MKLRLISVFFASAALAWIQVLSGDEHLHIHTELPVQRTGDDVVIVSGVDRLYRVSEIHPGPVFASIPRVFSTRDAATQYGESLGCEFIIEVVDREGKAAADARTFVKYPLLSYCGMRP